MAGSDRPRNCRAFSRTVLAYFPARAFVRRCAATISSRVRPNLLHENHVVLAYKIGVVSFFVVVGIELGRADFRWRVTNPALSVAEWVHSSTMATFPEAPL